jgi:hypothetical protein
MGDARLSILILPVCLCGLMVAATLAGRRLAAARARHGDGGQPVGAWHWFQHSGVATGGDYVDRNTSASCKPYPFPSCAHHTTPPDGMVACSTLPMFRTPTCKATCDDAAYPIKYTADKKKAKSTGK